MTIARVALCSVRYCPEPRNPDWHQCVVCQDPAIEHHHVENRGMGGSKRDIPVIALCHAHHSKITLNEWGSGVLPDGRIVIWGLHGNTVWESHGNGRREEEAGAAGVPGTLPDTGLPEGPGFPELGENDGRRSGEAILEGEADRSRGGLLAREGSGPERGTHHGGIASAVINGGDSKWSGHSNQHPLDSPDFGPDYLNLPEEFTLQDAVPWAAMVGKWEHGRQWYAGDLLLACEARFGHERLWGHSVSPDGKTFVDLLGMTYPSLRNCQRVCETFSPGERFPLSFGHHAATYSLERTRRDSLMDMALGNGWTVAQLRRAVSGGTVTETCICPTCGKEHRKEPTT